MDQFVGLDISMEDTSVCVVNQLGQVTYEGVVATKPEAIAKVLRAKGALAIKILFETGALSNWLWHALNDAGFPVVCVDARHTHKALSMRMNKSDKNDARGLADIARIGWYREVSVKSANNQLLRSLLSARTKLVSLRRNLDNQIRGLCKGLGILFGKAGSVSLAKKVEAKLADAVELRPIIGPLILAQKCMSEQIESFDRQVLAIAKADETACRLMTVPGVGPMTALSFMATVDDPRRFKSSADVGAYFGLTPRRYQSGEIDRTGRISKWGDSLSRCCLYEAATVLLTVVRRGSALKRWGAKLVKRIGQKKARVAVARKLATILHAIWSDGTEFQPEGQKI